MKEQILEMIAHGKTKEALQILAKYNPEAILLQSKFTNLEREQRLGLLDYDTYGRELNKINYSMMSMLDMTDFSDKTTAETENGNNKPFEQKNVFLSYAKEDDQLQQRLRVHLAPLRRSQRINDWSEAEILPGMTMSDEVRQQLQRADIILLLVSPDFIASDKLWDTDVKIAMERHDKGEAIVVPIVLKPCQWNEMPFGKLKPLPTNGQPATLWDNMDRAFFEVAEGIKKLL